MLKWLKFLFFLLSLDMVRCGRSFCENSCPSNEVYSRNVSQCQNTCFNRKFNVTSNCHAGPGCVCGLGYTRHQNSYKCVKITACPVKESPKQCPINEVYSECGAGCFKTCSSQNFTTTCGCKSGCVCKKGFIRSDVNFQCIPEASCKSKNYNLVVHCKIVWIGVKISKFFTTACPKGYRFVEASNLCVLDCKTCSVNEFYNGCGTCELTCQRPEVEACTQDCREGEFYFLNIFRMNPPDINLLGNLVYFEAV